MAEIVDLNISRRAAAETFFASQHLSLGRTNSEIALREGHIGKKKFFRISSWLGYGYHKTSTDDDKEEVDEYWGGADVYNSNRY